MRKVGLAGSGVLIALLAGCGSSSPTQAQVLAQKQWFAAHHSVLLNAAAMTTGISGSTSPLGCRQIAQAAMDGQATAPMPVASLETLWRSYLVDLTGMAEACAQGDQAEVANKKGVARATFARLTEVANSLPAEFHQLPPG